jgi:thymidylate synthase
MNNIEHDYLKLLNDIMVNGVTKSDRTGTGTKSVFGRQIRHDMSLGFPLLTTKKMSVKTIVTELLWFLRGDTNIKYLVDNNCHIWDGDAYKAYLNDKTTDPDACYSKEEFINAIKTNDAFAKAWGELGKIYGYQWREWGARYETNQILGTRNRRKPGIDQIAKLVEDLKTNPDSRRLMVTAWNPNDLDEMVLPPCHYGFQCYVRKGKYLSLMWNQRSVDTPLGLPFNIASYAVLLELLAMEVNMIPDELVGNLGDCHIYLDQVDGVKEQLTRSPLPLGKLIINNEFWNPDSNVFDQLDMRPTDFYVDGYESHPTIKFPLSN